MNTLPHANPRIRSGKEFRLAFRINAYNAVTIKGIFREYPTTSIRNHTTQLYGYNIWKDLLLIVGDRSYSLKQIEHDERAAHSLRDRLCVTQWPAIAQRS